MPPNSPALLRIALIALPTVLATVGARRIISASPMAQPPAQTPTAVQLESQLPFVQQSKLAAVPELDRPVPLRRFDPDPFDATELRAEAVAVGDSVDARASGWSVTAILIAGDKRMAVVNDKLVTLGTRLPGGERVIAIENNHIEVMEPGGSRRIVAIQESGTE